MNSYSEPIKATPYKLKLTKKQNAVYNSWNRQLKKEKNFLGVSIVFTLDVKTLSNNVMHLDSLLDTLKDYDQIPLQERELFLFSEFPIDTPISLYYKGYQNSYVRELVKDTVGDSIVIRKVYHVDNDNRGHSMSGKRGSDIQPINFTIRNNSRYPIGSYITISYWHNTIIYYVVCLGENVFAIFKGDILKYYENIFKKKKENRNEK